MLLTFFFQSTFENFDSEKCVFVLIRVILTIPIVFSNIAYVMMYLIYAYLSKLNCMKSFISAF